jgi:hypothetical protein
MPSLGSTGASTSGIIGTSSATNSTSSRGAMRATGSIRARLDVGTRTWSQVVGSPKPLVEAAISQEPSSCLLERNLIIIQNSFFLLHYSC